MNYLSKLSQLLIAFILLFAATASIGYAQESPTSSPRQVEIVGGQNANPGEYPWQVSVQNANGHFCGGSLISTEWVLTAAHCLIGESAANVQIVAGAHNISSSSEATRQLLDVTQIISHAGYDDNTLVNDIALIRLSRPATLNANVATVSYATSNVAVGTLATVTGWGTLSQGGQAPDILQEVSVPVVSQEICKQAYPGEITDGMVCAGLAEGGKDSCQGDSGGPLVISNGSNGWLQVGVVSWGAGCAAPNAYGVYTQIAQYSAWIQANMSGTTAPPSNPAPSTPAPSTPVEEAPVDDNGETNEGDHLCDDEFPEEGEFDEGDFGDEGEDFLEEGEFNEGEFDDSGDETGEEVDWFTIAANTIGISEDAFWQALDTGQSIAAVATENSVNAQAVVDAITSAETAFINQAVADGYITQAEGTEWISELPQYVNDFVNSAAGRQSPQGMTVNAAPTAVALGFQVFMPAVMR